MKTTALLTALALSFALAACSKQPAEAEATPEAAAAAAAEKAKAEAEAEAEAEANKPRLAKFDPNLKPSNIVWDSPEKKRDWEARQAKLRADQAAAAAKGAHAAPAR